MFHQFGHRACSAISNNHYNQCQIEPIKQRSLNQGIPQILLCNPHEMKKAYYSIYKIVKYSCLVAYGEVNGYVFAFHAK